LFDTLDLAESLLDAPHAGGAGHPGDRERDLLRRRFSLCGHSRNCSLTRQLEQLAQLTDHLLVAALFEACRDARAEVALEQGAFERLERSLDGIRLVEDVDAVLVGFDHLADALEVALDGRQAVQDLLLVGLHRGALLSHSYPSPGGRGLRESLVPFSPAVNPLPGGWDQVTAPSVEPARRADYNNLQQAPAKPRTMRSTPRGTTFQGLSDHRPAPSHPS